MKPRVIIGLFLGLLLVGLVVMFSGGHGHDPKDVAYWLRAGAGKDWSSEAAQGRPEAQFHFGLTLIRSNLVTMIDEVPGWSAVPLIGKRFFKKITYAIDSSIGQEQLLEAYQWITKSADGGFAPASELEKLFVGRVAAQKTNRTSSATGSFR